MNHQAVGLGGQAPEAEVDPPNFNASSCGVLESTDDFIAQAALKVRRSGVPCGSNQQHRHKGRQRGCASRKDAQQGTLLPDGLIGI
jgi:hypothetical protein